MTSSARYSGPVSENPAKVGVGTRHPGAYAWAVISTTLAPRITNAQKMKEWSTPAYHSRATFLWKIPYTMKFLRRVGRWSHRRSFRCAVNRYWSRRYILRPKIDRETARKAVTAAVSRAVRAMVSRGRHPALFNPHVLRGRSSSGGPRLRLPVAIRPRRRPSANRIVRESRQRPAA